MEAIVEPTGPVAPSTSDEVEPMLTGTEKRLAAARALVKELEPQETEQKREKARRAARARGQGRRPPGEQQRFAGLCEALGVEV